MSRTVHELVGLITSNVGGFVKGMGRAARATDDMRDKWLQAGRSIDQVATRIGTALGAVAAFTAKVGIEANAMQESATVSFETMLGSAEKARTFLEELNDFAKRTPFELRGLIQTSQKLLAFGFAAEDIVPMLTSVGDAVAALGGDPQVMERVVTALGQIRAKAKASAEEMLQLAEAGIPAWQFLADHLGVTIPEAMDKVSKGAVDAETTIAALTAGMDSKFAGMMEKQSTRFSGLWSTLVDNARQGAAKVVEPLFEALGQLFARVNAWAETPEFQQFLADARTQVQELVDAAREAAPGLLETARAFGELLKPMLKFLLEHPNLLAALLALKAGQTLGINAALFDTGRAIASTVGSVMDLTREGGKVGGVLRTMASNGGLAKVAIGGLAIAAIAVLATEIYKAMPSIQEFNEQLAEASRLSDELAKKTTRDQQKIFEQAGRLQGADRKAFLEAQLADAEKNLTGLQASKGGQEKLVDSMEPTWLSLGQAGRKMWEAEKATLDETNARLAAQKDLVQQLRDELERSGFEDALTEQAPEIGRTVGDAAADKLATKMQEEAERAAERLQAALANADRALLDQQADGASGFRDILGMEGITPEQATKLASTMPGVSPGLAESFGHSFDAMGGAGASSQDKDALAINMANEANAAMAAEAAAGQLEALRQQIVGLGTDGGLTQQQVTGYDAALTSLMEQLRNGTITADQFTEAINKVGQAAQESAAAAAREAEEKKRAALLEGDFEGAGLNQQKALEERIAAFRMQQFNGEVERSFQNWLKVNGHLEKAGDGLRKLGEDAQRAREQFVQQMQQRAAQAQQAAVAGQAALATVTAFLATKQGQITAILNNIEMLKQMYRLVQSGYRRQQILEEIQRLNAQLVDLMNESPPFVGTSGDALFKDPGLGGEEEDSGNGKQVEGAGGGIQLSFPNITRFTANDARNAVRMIREEMARQGRPV